MKKFMNEFKEFAMRGNVMDMAVGMIIGAAFTAIVTSLVDDLLSPVLGVLVQVDFNDLAVRIGEVDFRYGAFIMAVINFIIVAFALFVIVKGLNKMASLGRKTEEDTAPSTKICPFCKTEIHIDAARCPNCTSRLD